MGTALTATRATSVGAGDAAWPEAEPASAVQRRPAWIPLGRLLVDILELDAQCHALEARRNATLRQMQQHAASATATGDAWYAPSTADVAALGGTTFDSPFPAASWAAYAEFTRRLIAASPAQQAATGSQSDAAASGTRSATERLLRLGLEAVLGEYCLPLAWLHENILTGTMVRACGFDRTRAGPQEWAEGWSREMDADTRLAADVVRRLCRDAVVEQLCALPVVRDRAMAAFVAAGCCDVVPTGRSAERDVRRVSLQAMIHQDPAVFLDMLEAAAGGTCTVELRVEPSSLEDALPMAEVLRSCGLGPNAADTEAVRAWRQEILAVRGPAAQRLAADLTPYVRTMLHEAALRAAARRSSEALGSLLAEGPFSRTSLRLTSYLESGALWPCAFEVAEALPARAPNGIVPSAAALAAEYGRARVCGVYRGDNKITVFAFIDEAGVLRATVRWHDVADRTSEGREKQAIQHAKLLQACIACRPAVFAIAVKADVAVQRLYRELERAERELLQPELRVHTPIVWASPTEPKVAAGSQALLQELPHSDEQLRVALAVARRTQDPLKLVLSVFDTAAPTDVTTLPLGCEGYREGVLPRRSGGVLARRLEFEASLWIGASGVDVNELISMPGVAAQRILQFVPGLGRRKAAALLEALRMDGGRVRSRAALRELMQSAIGAAAAANALPVLRVVTSARMLADERNGNGNGNAPVHPLDTTLIPPAWYPVAGALARAAIGAADTASDAAALVRLLLLTPAERATRLRAVATPNMIEAVVNATSVPHVHAYEVDFIIDELLAPGLVRARRNFRRMTDARYFTLVTGLSYVDAVAPSTAAALLPGQQGRRALTLRPGDIVEGQPEHLFLREGGDWVLRLRLSKGGVQVNVRGETLAQDVAVLFDAIIRDAKAAIASGRRKRSAPVPATAVRDMSLYARIDGIDLERASDLGTYVPGPSADQSGYAVGMRSARESGAASEQSGARSSIRASALERLPRTDAPLAARHVLYRNVAQRTALQLLQDAHIGETLLRPCSDRTSGDFIVCVRVGTEANAVMNIPVFEDHGPDGRTSCRLVDEMAVGDKTLRFGDVDHLLASYVDPMARLFRELQNQRRFAPTREFMKSALEEALAADPRALAYAIVETPNHARSAYQVVVAVTGQPQRELRVRASGATLLLQHPRMPNQWLRGSSADEVIEQMKRVLCGGRS
jgi:transcriptional accessory protein Tex/SPT6